MNSSLSGVDVYAFVKRSGCSSASSKIGISSDNKINIFQNEAALKTFKFDCVCYEDSMADVLQTLSKSITEDVVESMNRIIFVCKLQGNDVTHAVNLGTFSSLVLNNLYTTANAEKNADISLHVSCFRVDGKGIVDLMQESTSNALKVFELTNLIGSNLIERIVTNTEDIEKIIESVFLKAIPKACLECYHTVLLSTLIVKIRDREGFVKMKTGRFILVDIENCIHLLKEVTSYMYSRRESFYLNHGALLDIKDRKSCNCTLSEILKNFLGNSKISVLTTLPSSIDCEHIPSLKIISEMQNLRLNPVLNEKLILAESLKVSAGEIKALEKDLSVLKNNNGILTNHQKYKSLKNRLLLSETQVRDLHKERKALTDRLSSKKEILSRLQQEIKLRNVKIEEENQKLKLSKIALEESEKGTIALNQRKMEKVDACVSMNNLINFNTSCVKNQKSHLLETKHSFYETSSTLRRLSEQLNSHAINTAEEQKKLKERIESLLSYLKETLQNSKMQQNSFILNANEFHQKFEKMMRLWKQFNTDLTIDFHSFMEGILHNSYSLKNNLCSELISLNFTEGVIIEILKKNESEALQRTASCSTEIQISVENSIKLLYEQLCILEIVQGKVKEQLKKLESTICNHSNERMKFLSNTSSTMASMLKYLHVHLDLSSNTNSDIFCHHQELKQHANQEFMKINEALNSLKKLFGMQQKFVIDKWQQKQTCLSNIKEIGGVSESLQQCTEEDPILLDKLRQQSVSSIDELYLILREKIITVDNLGSKLIQMFYEIESGLKNYSDENTKRVNQQDNNIRDNHEIQTETIRKCINTTRFLLDDIAQYVNGGLQNTRNSFFNIKDLKKTNDVNKIISILRNNLNDYIRNYVEILKLSELALHRLPENVPMQNENHEVSVEFNHEELLSSTPCSSHERTKNIDDKTKFLNRLREMVTSQVNIGYQNNLSLDQESTINTFNLSFPSTSTGSKVEIQKNRSFIHRRAAK